MSMPQDLSGRTILVTGASSGIGRACAEKVAELGARVALVGRDEQRLESVVGSLAGDGHRWWTCDLSQTDNIAPSLGTWHGEMGAFDGLVHAAGIYTLKPVRAESHESIDRTFRINTYAAIQLVGSLFARKAASEEGGAIVLVSSVAALSGPKGHGSYCASKGAIISLTRSLGAELANRNWRINAVAPGFVHGRLFERYSQMAGKDATDAMIERHPLGIGQPSDVACAVAFLLGSGSKWITGVTLPVDGGFLCQ